MDALQTRGEVAGLDVAVEHAAIAMADFERAVSEQAQAVHAMHERFAEIRSMGQPDRAIMLAKCMSDALDAVARSFTAFDLEVMTSTHKRLVEAYSLDTPASVREA